MCSPSVGGGDTTAQGEPEYDTAGPEMKPTINSITHQEYSNTGNLDVGVHRNYIIIINVCSYTALYLYSGKAWLRG